MCEIKHMQTVDYVLYLLENRMNIEASVEIMIQCMCPETEDECIEGMSAPGMAYDRITVSPTNKPGDTTSRIVDTWKKEIREQIRDISVLRAKVGALTSELQRLRDMAISQAEPYRSILLMYYWQNVNIRDIARRLNCSKSKVSEDKSRAIILMAETYDKISGHSGQVRIEMDIQGA